MVDEIPRSHCCGWEDACDMCGEYAWVYKYGNEYLCSACITSLINNRKVIEEQKRKEAKNAKNRK